MTIQPIETTLQKFITIQAPASKVWLALTDTSLLKIWMTEEKIEIHTSWKVGASIVIRGNLHGINFENKGLVLKYEEEKVLSYNYLSSLSNLPDDIDNYSTIEFKLSPMQDRTHLRVTLSNFPTESIYKHLDFYWTVTLHVLKKFIENIPRINEAYEKS